MSQSAIATADTLVRDPAAVDELLKRLDELAKNHNTFECGLPVWNEGQMALMREAVYQWAAGLTSRKPVL